MTDNLVLLSDVIIRNPEVSSFKALLAVIGQQGKDGKTMLQIDLKPDFSDTPRNWEFLVESAFTWGDQ